VAEPIEELIGYIVTVLTTAPSLGIVHPYEPIATAAADIPSVFGGSQRVQAWSVSEGAVSDTILSNAEDLLTHQVVVRLYLEVGDPALTEPAARALSRAAMLRWRPIYQYPADTGALFEQVSPMSRTKMGHTLLGGTLLCHFLEFTIDAKERVSRLT
jgi:hypothetical protein